MPQTSKSAHATSIISLVGEITAEEASGTAIVRVSLHCCSCVSPAAAACMHQSASGRQLNVGNIKTNRQMNRWTTLLSKAPLLWQGLNLWNAKIGWLLFARRGQSHLFHLAEFVHASLISLHAVLREVQVSRVTIQLLLILRHFLDHLREVTHGRLVLCTHSFLVAELLQLLCHLSTSKSTTTLASWSVFNNTFDTYTLFCVPQRPLGIKWYQFVSNTVQRRTSQPFLT